MAGGAPHPLPSDTDQCCEQPRLRVWDFSKGVLMAGMGPPPKDSKRRARINEERVPETILRSEYADQPALPAPPEWLVAWPERTLVWWRTWGESPQAEHLTSTDWDFLLDTALIHAQVWGEGKMTQLPELRLRVAKFGATLEDRARLRLVFAEADEKDAKRPVGTSARERYASLTVLPGG